MLEDLKNKERELKVMLTKDQFEKLLNSYDFPITIRQTNTYFDTEDETLKKQGGAVRIRTIDDQTKIFTLKKRIDAITLIELEKQTDVSDVKEIKDPEILEWLHRYDIPVQELKPIVTFETIRHLIETKDAEICLDENKFEHSIDYEIEYEYKKDHDGIHEFNIFLHCIHLKFKKNGPSKIARAMMDQKYH